MKNERNYIIRFEGIPHGNIHRPKKGKELEFIRNTNLRPCKKVFSVKEEALKFWKECYFPITKESYFIENQGKLTKKIKNQTYVNEFGEINY